MRVLFFIVHPAKYHLFKNTFKLLQSDGCEFEVVISNKDILSKLLTTANIPFTDIFPRGRKIPGLPFYLSAGINLIRTLWRLNRFTTGKKYDAFVTDDVLTILGRLKGVPAIAFTDNDITTIPKVKSIFRFADKIIAPHSTNLGEFESKKISFRGNKALAHLHPKYFSPDPSVINKYNLSGRRLLIIRLASLTANHDLHGNAGITDSDLHDIFEIVPSTYTIIICAERSVPEKYERYISQINENDFTQVLAQADFFIGDSGTMATEAAVCGVPNILINNVAKKCGVHMEMKEHKLQEYFDDYSNARATFREMVSDPDIKRKYKMRSAEYASGAEDFNEVLVTALKKIRKDVYN